MEGKGERMERGMDEGWREEEGEDINESLLSQTVQHLEELFWFWIDRP